MKLLNETYLNRKIKEVPWTSWTPTITAASGSFTTITLNSCAYKVLGKILFFHLDYTVTNKGTAGAYTIVSTPPGGTPLIATGASGREYAASGEIVQMHVNTSNLLVLNRSGGYIGATGHSICVDGFYEIA